VHSSVLDACTRLGRPFLVLALFGGVLQRGNAADTLFSLGYSLQHSDNIQLAPANKQNEWINTATVSYAFQENSVSLEGGVQGSAAYHDYRRNTFSDRSVFGLNANLKWKILPERFWWTLEDFFTQTAIQPLEPDTPTNRQNANVFSTGPNYTLRLSPVHSMQFGARHTESSFEKSDLDSTRNTGNVGWIYQATPRTTLTLNYSAEAVDYKNETLNPNFDRQDAFLQISHRLSRNLFLLEGGSTSIHRDRAADVDGSRERFSWTRELTPASTFNLSVSSELSDVTRETLAAAATAEPGIPGNIVDGDVFRSKKADLVFTHRRTYGSDVVSLFRHEQDFQISPSDQERRGGNINVGYDFTAAVTGVFFASSAKVVSTGVTPVTEYKDTIIGLSLSDRLTKTLNLGFELSQKQRDSVDPLRTYTENRASLTLSYSSASRLSR